MRGADAAAAHLEVHDLAHPSGGAGGAAAGDGASCEGRSGGIAVLERAIGILRALGDSAGVMSLGEIAERCELPRSTVHRIVHTLRDAGFVAQGPGYGRLRLGPELARLAAVSGPRLVPVLRPFLEQLSRRLEEGASLAVLDGCSVRFLDQVISGAGLRAVSLVGSCFPVHCTANGKALLAELAPPQLAAVLPAELERLTPSTIVERDLLLAELERVRQSGVAIDREEHAEGISAVGAVVRDAVGNIAALTVAMPASRLEGRESEVVAAVLEVAARASEALRHGAELS